MIRKLIKALQPVNTKTGPEKKIIWLDRHHEANVCGMSCIDTNEPFDPFHLCRNKLNCQNPDRKV